MNITESRIYLPEIPYFEDLTHNLVRIMNEYVDVRVEDGFIVGIVNGHQVCPMFDRTLRMVIVCYYTREVIPMYPNYVVFANQFRFLKPERLRSLSHLIN